MNACVFEGRLAKLAEERELPSGDRIVVFSVIVDREDARGVDTIECVVRPARLRVRIQALDAGVWLRVEGALHRRFWRHASGVSSRYEVEASKCVRLRHR